MPLLALLPVLLLSKPVCAEVHEAGEQILEQDRASHGLWFAFQERIAGLRVRLSEDVNAGARYDDTGVDGFNNRRLLEPLGHVPPAEFEEMYYEELDSLAKEAALN